jgi:spermidine/putrescine transport system substrate-binding protein
MRMDHVLSTTMDRRSFLRAAAISGVGLLASCRRAPTAAPASPGAERPPIEAEPDVLTVFEWAGYDIAPLFKPYLRAGFPKPKFTYMTSDDQALAKVRGGFAPDVVHPCIDYTWDWVNLGVVQPWDTSLISNFSKLDPNMVAQGQVDGDQYHIPVDWGFSAPLYRADKVEPLEDSWTIMYDERYAGKISWWDDPINLIINAMIKGFEDPWNMTDEQLEDVKADLIEKKKVVRNFWQSQTDMENDFAAGNIWIVYAWPGTYAAMQKKGIPVVYMDPKETRLSWICGFVLMADTEAYYHAHEFVDAWLADRSAIWLLNNYYYGHSNTSVDLTKVDPDVVKAFSLDDPSILERTTFNRWIPDRAKYTQVWAEVKAA